MIKKIAKKKKKQIKKQLKKQIKKRKPALKKKSVIVKDDSIKKTKIRVIGIGGGAGSIVSEIASRIKKADFVAANTDARALLGTARKVRRFQFGQTLTHGLGTGMNTELGEMASQQDKEKIKKLFEGQDLCIIVSCLGGGTGGGASHIFAKLGRSSNCLTYGIFTLPFKFEGEKKMDSAKQALEKARSYLNAFSIIPNEGIFQIINKDTALKEALSAINQKLAQNLEGLIETIYAPGLINIDFADLRAILEGRGRLTYLNTIEIEGAEREEAVKRLISSPLYPYTIKGARGILYNIVGGKGLQLSEVSKISEIISSSVNKKARIIFGVDQQKKYDTKLKITLLATGCSIKNEILKTLQKAKLVIKKRRKRRIKALPFPLPLPPPPPPPPPLPPALPAPKKKRPKPKLKPKPKLEPQKPEITAEPQKLRRNALQIKKVIEEEEKELLEKEKIWETPAIFRRKDLK